MAAQTATGTLSRVLGRTVTDLGTKGVQVTQNDLDQYVATVDATQRPGSVWAAFGKAFRYQFMENTSEKLGGVFNALGGEQAVRQALRGLSEPMRDRLGKQALLLAVARANPGKKLEAERCWRAPMWTAWRRKWALRRCTGPLTGRSFTCPQQRMPPHWQ